MRKAPTPPPTIERRRPRPRLHTLRVAAAMGAATFGVAPVAVTARTGR